MRPGKTPAPRVAPAIPPGNAAKGSMRLKDGGCRPRRSRRGSRHEYEPRNYGAKAEHSSGALSGAGIRLRPPRAGTASGKDRGKPSVPVTGGPGTTPRLSRPQQAGNGACLFPELRKPAGHRNPCTEAHAGRRPPKYDGRIISGPAHAGSGLCARKNFLTRRPPEPAPSRISDTP